MGTGIGALREEVVVVIVTETLDVEIRIGVVKEKIWEIFWLREEGMGSWFHTKVKPSLKFKLSGDGQRTVFFNFWWEVAEREDSPTKQEVS